MTIELKDAAKRYNTHWIFRKFDFVFEAGQQYVLLGNNGSGKSTLMRCLMGLHPLSRGEIIWKSKGTQIPAGKIYQQISYAAPGMDLVESMTLRELLNFHFKFKKLSFAKDIQELLQMSDLSHAADILIEELSSGMKQRVKLLQAFFSETEMLFLDEPCSNLDAAGIQFYQDCMKNFIAGRLVIVASNDAVEYQGIETEISLSDYKV